MTDIKENAATKKMGTNKMGTDLFFPDKVAFL